MTKTERNLLLAVVFLAGCEASRVARSAVSTARADDTPGVQPWDYACIEPNSEDVQVEADRPGKRGWELVAASPVGYVMGGVTARWCFKRRAQ
jgi:hypothetical protein